MGPLRASPHESLHTCICSWTLGRYRGNTTSSPIFPDFLGILGILVIVEFYSHDYLLPWPHVFFFRWCPPGESLHQKCRTFRGEFDSSTLEAFGGFWVIVFEARRQTLETAAWRTQNLPDKKMPVGSLQSPREHDGRLPPDVGYYLNLVIPREDESRKKNTCMFE